MKRRIWLLAVLVALPLALFFPARLLADQRPVLLGQMKDARNIRIQFAPRGSRFVVWNWQNWAIGDLNERQLHVQGAIPLEDPVDDGGVFSSDGREFGWVQTLVMEDYWDTEGNNFPHPRPNLWKMTVFDVATGRTKGTVNFDAILSFKTGRHTWSNQMMGLSWNASAHEVRAWDALGHIQVFDDLLGKRTATLPCTVFPFSPSSQGHEAGVVIAPDGQTAVRFDPKHTVFVDATTGRVLWSWPSASPVQFSPDGLLALASTKGFLLARDARSGGELWRCPMPPVRNWTLAPNKNSLVEVRSDGSIWSWPLPRPKPRAVNISR